MGPDNHNAVVVTKMGVYIHGCLFSMDAYYPDFMVPYLEGNNSSFEL